MSIDIKKIEKAKENYTENVVIESPLEYSHRLSRKYNARVYLKREDTQIVRSYKIRGAFNTISMLSDDDKRRGVVCASAGNHAQGFALSCKHFKIKGKVFMPMTTPMQKVNKTKKFGGQYVDVELIGDTFDEAFKKSMEFCDKNKAVFIHPFDNLNTIAGQGTVGLEIYNQSKYDIDYLFVPIGGGGLVSGIGSYFKVKSPKTKIIGVEPEGAPAMKESIKAGKVIELNNINTFVDGASVKKVGNYTFKIAKDVVDKVVLVPENRICTTILEFLQEEGVVVEPAGSLSVDCLKDFKDKIEGKTVVCVISGGNLDFERINDIKNRALKFQGLKRFYRVIFPQRAGALREFLDFLGPKDDIVKFEYEKIEGKNVAPVLIGIQSNSSYNLDMFERKLTKSNFTFDDITYNKLMK